MALVIPSASIARHWNGALPARLRRAPLEQFLRARGLDVSNAGAARDSDNVARATVFLLEAGVTLYFQGAEDPPAKHQHAALGLAACSISHALAALIEEPASWRIAALISTAQVLRPWIGLNAAALASALIAREFTVSLEKSLPAADAELGKAAAAAVTRNDPDSGAAVAPMILQRLARATDTAARQTNDYMISSHIR
jgi:hypothetical protein